MEIVTQGYVTNVVDGDTLDVSDFGRIRLADIDAPDSGKPGYDEAKNYLISLVNQKLVYIERDDEKDPYGRFVCIIYVRQNSTHLLNVNKALLNEGVVEMDDYPNEFDPDTWTPYVYYPINEPMISTIIYCNVSQSNLTIWNSTLIYGSIYPTFLEIVNITLSIKSEEGLWSDLVTVKNDFHYAYFYSWTPEYAGSYEIKASWDGFGIYDGSQSNTTLVQVNKISTKLSCSVSSTTITREESVIVSGIIDPSLSAKTIRLTYTKPEGIQFIRTVTTKSNGSFNDSYSPDADGSWSVTASWDGDLIYQDASCSKIEFIVNTSLIGGPGWIDDVAVIGGVGLVLISFFIFLRLKTSRSIWRQ
jgi:hypothetical protein